MSRYTRESRAPLDIVVHLGKLAAWEKPLAFHFDASAFWSLGRERGRQESHVSKGVELGFIGHAYDQKTSA